MDQEEHPCITKKMLHRGILHEDELYLDMHNNLVIPMYDIEGELQTAQFISPDGDKIFKKFLPKEAAFALVGRDRIQGFLDDLDTCRSAIIICEGWATGPSDSSSNSRVCVNRPYS